MIRLLAHRPHAAPRRPRPLLPAGAAAWPAHRLAEMLLLVGQLVGQGELFAGASLLASQGRRDAVADPRDSIADAPAPLHQGDRGAHAVTRADLERLAATAGLALEAVTLPAADLANALHRAAPLLLPWPDNDAPEPGWFAVLPPRPGRRGRRPHLLALARRAAGRGHTADIRREGALRRTGGLRQDSRIDPCQDVSPHRHAAAARPIADHFTPICLPVAASRLAGVLHERLAAAAQPAIDPWLDAAGVPARRRAPARAALLADRLRAATVPAWLLHPALPTLPAGAAGPAQPWRARGAAGRSCPSRAAPATTAGDTGEALLPATAPGSALARHWLAAAGRLAAADLWRRATAMAAWAALAGAVQDGHGGLAPLAAWALLVLALAPLAARQTAAAVDAVTRAGTVLRLAFLDAILDHHPARLDAVLDHAPADLAALPDRTAARVATGLSHFPGWLAAVLERASGYLDAAPAWLAAVLERASRCLDTALERASRCLDAAPAWLGGIPDRDSAHPTGALDRHRRQPAHRAAGRCPEPAPPALGGDSPGAGASRLRAHLAALDTLATFATRGAVTTALAMAETAALAILLAHRPPARAAADPAAAWRLPLLATATAAALALGTHLAAAQRAAAAARHTAAQPLLEALAGHRTRRVQEPPADRHRHEDAALAATLLPARRRDRATRLLRTVLPRAWLLAALATFLPTAALPAPLLQLQLAAVALAAGALSRLGAGLCDLAETATSCPTAAVLLRRQTPPSQAAVFAAPPSPPPAAATGAPIPPRLPLPLPTAAPAPAPVPPHGFPSLLTTFDLIWRPPGRTAPAVEGCTLAIAAGDRIVLSGPAGGGKSALAALLAAQQAPTAGLLLLDGLDTASLGAAAWRRRVVAVPQPDDNHLFAASLAVNLLPGAAATTAGLPAAAALCRELGLGELLERMPAGLAQTVGEAGWALSQGEIGRVLLARALLQQPAPQVLILDGCLAALDPPTARRVLACILRRVPTLILIEQP